jgi:hypothetical protein
MRVAGIGEHTVEALNSAGLSNERIETLAKSRAVVIGQPMDQKLMPSYR